MPPDLPRDSRAAQIKRVAAYLAASPGATLKDIDAACDTGSATKVLSEMRRIGYGLRREMGPAIREGGRHLRRTARYWLTAWPVNAAQGDLFDQT
jgi:hypothetical protein